MKPLQSSQRNEPEHRERPSAGKALPPEEQLDRLLESIVPPSPRGLVGRGGTDDPLERLRRLTAEELIPTFRDLVSKYAPAGISMQMDASDFLEGGREIKFQFAMNGHHVHMHGTVTTEAVAFHETRSSPHVRGELLSGPMLRLRGLDANRFRQFICERLARLVRDATRTVPPLSPEPTR